MLDVWLIWTLIGIGAKFEAGLTKDTGPPIAAGDETPPWTWICPVCIIPTASISVILSSCLSKKACIASVCSRV